MPTVQSAIGRFLAVAPVLAPPLLLIPEVPFICEVTNVLCLQSEVPLEKKLHVFEPTLPDAKDASADAEVAAWYA